ncbi:MAG: response regulator [Minisyncoccia bacterium]
MSKEIKDLKILIVDDDRFLLDMYALKFKKLGLQFDTSSSSTNALEILRKNNDYDIVLLDVIMPGIDGLELLGKIREEKLVPNATIIMLTNQVDDSEKAKTLDVDGYLVKAMSIPSEVVDQVLSIHNNKNKN